MTMLIKVQVWRDGVLLTEDSCPVSPGAGLGRHYGPFGTEPLVDGNTGLRGFKLEVDAEYGVKNNGQDYLVRE